MNFWSGCIRDTYSARVTGFFSVEGVKQQQVLQLLLLGPVVVQGAQLQLAAEAAVELLIALPVVLQHPLQLGLDLLFQAGGDNLQLPVMLQQFPEMFRLRSGDSTTPRTKLK